MKTAEYEIMYRQEADHWWYRGLRSLVDLAWERFRLAGTARVIDVGCGTGGTAKHLEGRAEVVCLDVSRLALGWGRERGIGKLVQGSAERLPVPDGAFDVVLLLDVLYHRGVADKVGALREARRVMADNGVVMVNVPAYTWLYSQHDRAVHTDRRFTRRELRDLLQSAGFAPAWLTYWNGLLLPAVAAKRKLLNGTAGETSDTAQRLPRVLERLFSGALTAERWAMRAVPLPVGVSIFGVARKRE